MYIKGCNEVSQNNLDLLMIINKQYYSSYSILAFPQRLHEESYDYYVLDSSNGLFLCMAKTQYLYKLFICNPIIKQWIKLPEPRHPISLRNCLGLSFTTQIDEAGTITSNKLVIFHLIPYQFEIFSSETATWRTRNISPLSRREWPAVANGLSILSDIQHACPLSHHKFVAVVNGSGILHWVTEFRLRILAYDPSDRDWYRVINLFNDNLRYLKILQTPGEDYHLYIWTLEGYDDGGQWHLNHKILLRDIHLRFYICAKIHDYKLDNLIPTHCTSGY